MTVGPMWGSHGGAHIFDLSVISCFEISCNYTDTFEVFIDTVIEDA